MKPSEVTETGCYEWSWKAPAGNSAIGICNVVRDDNGRLMYENGLLLDDVENFWPLHVVEMRMLIDLKGGE